MLHCFWYRFPVDTKIFELKKFRFNDDDIKVCITVNICLNIQIQTKI